MTLHVEPVQFSWSGEWLPRVRRQLWDGYATGLDLVTAVSAWTRETDDWLRGLSAKKQSDALALLKAECELLWMRTDDADRDPAARFDFRQRWFDAMPLALAAERIGLDGGARVVERYRELEGYAETLGWLP